MEISLNQDSFYFSENDRFNAYKFAVGEEEIRVVDHLDGSYSLLHEGGAEVGLSRLDLVEILGVDFGLVLL